MGVQTSLPRFDRAAAKYENEFGVLSRFERATSAGCAEHRRLHVRQLRRAVAAVVIEVAAAQVEQALERLARGYALDSGRIVDVHRIVAVRLDHASQLAGDGIDRLFPADALELTLAASADALERVAQTIWAVHPTPIGASAQTGARLAVFERSVGRCVGLHPNDLVILHVKLERTTARAVDGAVTPHHLVRRVGVGMRGSDAEQRTRRRRSTTRRRQRSERTRRFHEGASAYARHRFLHRCSPFSMRSARHVRLSDALRNRSASSRCRYRSETGETILALVQELVT